MKEIEVRRADGSLLCRAQLADNMWTRGKGLLGRSKLEPDRALLIRPCSSVHTWFMRFTIDVLYVDVEGFVVKAVTLRPFRFSLGRRGAKSVLELPAGTIGMKKITVGERLEITNDQIR